MADNRPDQRIEAIIKNARCNSYSDVNFVKHSDGLLRQGHLPYFEQKLRGKRFLDLGCGHVESAYAMVRFATLCNVSSYVGVDRFCGWGRSIPEYAKNQGLVDAIFHYDDMLRFLAQQDSGRANVCMNGIDNTILTSREYRDEVVKQVARVVPLGGIAFGVGSEVLEGLKNHGLQRKTEILGFPIFGESISYELVFEK